MLKALHLKSSLLEADVAVAFGPGLNVLTGETGAGKSLLLEGIAFALGLGGGRLSRGETTVTLTFEGRPKTIERRSRAGKSRILVDGAAAKTADLKAKAAGKILLQGQGAGRKLQDETAQRAILDQTLSAEESKVLDSVSTLFHEMKQKERALSEVEAALARAQKERDFLTYQAQELAALPSSEEAEQELKLSLDRLEHQEEITRSLQEAYRHLYEAEGAAVERADLATRLLGGIAPLSPDAAALAARLSSCREQMSDIARELRALAEEAPVDAAEAERMRETYFRWQELKRKYRKTLPELKAFREELAGKLRLVTEGDDAVATRKAELSSAQRAFAAAAAKLSHLRKKRARAFQTALQRELKDLSLEHALFRVEISPATPSETGTDTVRFLFCSDGKSKPQPLAKVASGGELSRLHLAVTLVLSRYRRPPTLILDEVETGVGGQAAVQMGKKLAELGRRTQVLLVTHQPAIAAFADRHFHVDRRYDEASQIRVELLDRRRRLQELARMLRGASKTKSAMELADELLSLAGSG